MGRHALGRAENGGWAWVELSGRVRVWFIWWWRSNLQPVALITHVLTTSHLWPVSIGSYRCLSPRECKGKHALCAPQMSCNRGGVKGRELGKGRGQEVMSIYSYMLHWHSTNRKRDRYQQGDQRELEIIGRSVLCLSHWWKRSALIKGRRWPSVGWGFQFSLGKSKAYGSGLSYDVVLLDHTGLSVEHFWSSVRDHLIC